MQQVSEIIMNKIPTISGIATILLIIYIIINIYTDWNVVLELCSRIWNLYGTCQKKYYQWKRKKYDKELCDRKFIDWQYDAMRLIYGDLINEKQQQGIKINLSKLEIGDKVCEYEAVTIQMREVSYPFEGICDKSGLRTKADIAKSEYSYDKKLLQRNTVFKKYRKLIQYTVRYPKRLGYMLNEIVIDNKSGECHISAYSGNYENNLMQSHILEYELYQLYKSMVRKRFFSKETPKLTRDFLMEYMPLRASIHRKFAEGTETEESDVLLSGKYRSSLLGVQMLVLVKNYSGSYDALRIRRSPDVAAKAGYLQFIPSGGFEAMNDATDFDAQWDNYSISKALFRELLEECFGIDEDSPKFSSNVISPDRIYYNPYIRELLCMLENKIAHLVFLGTSMNLVGLRQELCFLLRIDDASFGSQLTSNYESKSAIHLVDIRNLERGDFWCRSEADDDLKMLNCTSAGLFELARNSRLYQEALGNY